MRKFTTLVSKLALSPAHTWALLHPNTRGLLAGAILVAIGAAVSVVVIQPPSGCEAPAAVSREDVETFHVARDNFMAELSTVPGDVHIAMSIRSVPDGPHYSVEIGAEGDVTFRGVNGVARFTTQHRQISQSELLDILKTAGEVGFSNMGAAWAAATCKAPASDAGTVYLEIQAGGKSHGFSDDQGCGDFSPMARKPNERADLRKLQQLVRQIAVPDEWVEPRRNARDAAAQVRERLPRLFVDKLGSATIRRDTEPEPMTGRVGNAIYSGPGLTIHLIVKWTRAHEEFRPLADNPGLRMEEEALEVEGFKARRVYDPGRQWGEIVVQPTPFAHVRIEAEGIDSPEKLVELVSELPLDEVSAVR